MDNPKLRLLIALVGLVGAAIAIIVNVRGLLDPAPTVAAPAPGSTSSEASLPAAPAPTSAPSLGPTAPPRGTTTSEVPARQAGDCLSNEGGVVPCTAVHRFESIGVDQEHCDGDAALTYLGGNASLDVARVVVDYTFDACLVSSADQKQWSATVRNAFAAGGESGFWDELRSCVDQRLSQLVGVSCAVAHTGEYVGVPNGVVPDAAQCQTSAQAYLGVNLERAKPELTVLTLPTSDPAETGPHCIVALRGNNVLTASVRDIRTRALPLSPP